MKLLVTGASGFIGRHMIPRLSGHHQIFALVRAPRVSYLAQIVTDVAMDLSKPLDLIALPQQIDAIIHLAQANGSFPERANELFAVNTNATQQLLDYGRRAGAQQFILASTGDVYGQRRGFAKETDPAEPASYYGVIKHAAERLVQSYSDYLAPCILRLYQPYGPGQLRRLIPRLAERIQRQEAIQLHQAAHPYLTPIYIDDATCAIERAIDSSYSGVVNIAGDQALNMRELAEAIGHTLGSQPIFEEISAASADLMGDNRLMKRVLGDWPFTSLTEGLSRMFNHEEASPWQAYL